MSGVLLDPKTGRPENRLPHLEEILDASRGNELPILGTNQWAVDGQLVDSREMFGAGDDPVFGMAGFATYDDIINSLSINGFGERPAFNKTSITTVVGSLYSLWQAGGMPAGGTFGTALTGRAMDNTSTGAIQFTNAGSGRYKHLLTMGVGSTVGIGTVFLYDRLIEYPFTGTVTSGTFTSPSVPSRDTAGAALGAGVKMILETFSATATAAVTVTPTYTNQAGTGSKTNAFTSVVTSTQAGSLANPAAKVFLDLASGDTGVRTIQSYTLSASILAANMCFSLCRPLVVVPMLSSNCYVERDLVLQLANMPRLFDGTCLAMLLLANASTSPLIGGLVMSEN